MSEASPLAAEQLGIVDNGHLPSADALGLGQLILKGYNPLQLGEVYTLLTTQPLTRDEIVARIHPHVTRSDGLNNAKQNVDTTLLALEIILGYREDAGLELSEVGVDYDQRFSIGKRGTDGTMEPTGNDSWQVETPEPAKSVKPFPSSQDFGFRPGGILSRGIDAMILLKSRGLPTDEVSVATLAFAEEIAAGLPIKAAVFKLKNNLYASRTRIEQKGLKIDFPIKDNGGKYSLTGADANQSNDLVSNNTRDFEEADPSGPKELGQGIETLVSPTEEQNKLVQSFDETPLTTADLFTPAAELEWPSSIGKEVYGYIREIVGIQPGLDIDDVVRIVYAAELKERDITMREARENVEFYVDRYNQAVGPKDGSEIVNIARKWESPCYTLKKREPKKENPSPPPPLSPRSNGYSNMDIPKANQPTPQMTPELRRKIDDLMPSERPVAEFFATCTRGSSFTRAEIQKATGMDSKGYGFWPRAIMEAESALGIVIKASKNASGDIVYNRV